MSLRLVMRSVVLFASLVAIGALLNAVDVRALLDTSWIDLNVRGQGGAGMGLFVAIGAVAAGMGLPRQGVAFLGGYAFGLVEGAILALAACTLGCACCFFYARFIGRDWVRERFSERVRRIDSFLAGNTFAMTLLIRFLPVGSNLAVNLGAGVSGAGVLAFVAGSAIGYIPQTIVFALVGTGLELDRALHVALAAILFVVSGAIGVLLYKKFRHGRHLDVAIEREIGVDPNNGSPA